MSSKFRDLKKLSQLKPGMTVRAKFIPDRHFIVTNNYGKHVTATDTVDITHPPEWEVLIEDSCLVDGCINTREDGRLLPVGKDSHICGACLNMLKDGKIGPTKSFLKNICPCKKFNNIAPSYTGVVAFGFSPEA